MADYIVSAEINTAMSARVLVDSITDVDYGALYVAVWDDGTWPTIADVVNPVGAVGSGTQAVAAVGAQPTLDVAIAYNAHPAQTVGLVWKDAAEESTLFEWRVIVADSPVLTSAEYEDTTEGVELTCLSDQEDGLIYEYTKTTPFAGTDAERAQEIIDNGVSQPAGLSNSILHYDAQIDVDYSAGWVQTLAPNKLTVPLDFSDAYWSKLNVTVEASDVTAPDGSKTAWKISSPGANGALYKTAVAVDGDTKTMWARTVSGTGDVSIVYSNTVRVESLTEEWLRVDAEWGAYPFPENIYAVDFRSGSATLTEVIIWQAVVKVTDILAYPLSNPLQLDYTPALALTLDNETVDETGDGATLTIDSNSDAGTLYSYSKTTAFTGTDEENAAEIMANGVGQVPVIGTNTRVVTGQDQLTDYYAGWVQDSEGYGGDMVLVFNMGAGETLTIPGGTGTYLYNVDHGDGEFSEGLTTEGFSHTYTDANPETVVRISGTFPYIYFNVSADAQKLTKILNLGSVGWAAGARSFKGALNVTEFTVGVTDTSRIEFAQDMFRAFTRSGMVPKIAGLDMSSAINVSGMLAQWSGAGVVDLPIYSWSIENVINFTSFLLSTQLTTVCYDRTLASWGNQTLAAGALSTTINFGAASTYTDTASHALLLAQVAGIIDGGVAP